MSVSVRLIQLGRIFGESPDSLTGDRARQLIAARSADFARALFLEAADSDDVASIEDARLYLDARLVFFGDLVTPSAAAPIRDGFERHLASWR
jgi:hypothetical protein